MKEEVLHEFWRNNAVEYSPFYSREGKDITVISPGKPTATDGPDFQGGILEIDGEIWVGDVEVHRNESHWFQHGHDHNSVFDDVLLHVCLNTSTGRRTETPLNTVVLEDQPGSREWTESSDALCSLGTNLQEHPDRVSEVLTGLEEMGRKRILRKAHSDQREAINKSPEENRARIRNHILRALGLKSNREGMEKLIDRIHWSRLNEQLRERPPEQMQQAGEAILLSGANLLEQPRNPFRSTYAGADWKRYQQKCREIAEQADHCFRNESDEGHRIDWNTESVRPLNTPWRRIAGFVALYNRFIIDFPESFRRTFGFLFEDELVLKDQNGSVRRSILESLEVGTDDVNSFWLNHTVPSGPLETPAGLIGEHRAAVIWINAIYPYFLARSEQVRKKFSQRFRRLGREISLPLKDHRTDRVKKKLFGDSGSKIPMTPFMDQGMHALYKQYCRFGEPGCRRCPLKS